MTPNFCPFSSKIIDFANLPASISSCKAEFGFVTRFKARVFTLESSRSSDKPLEP